MTIADKIRSMDDKQMGKFLFAYYNRAQADHAYGLDDEDSISYMMTQDESRFDELLDVNYMRFIRSCLDEVGYCHIKMTLPDLNALIAVYGDRLRYNVDHYELVEKEGE